MNSEAANLGVRLNFVDGNNEGVKSLLRDLNLAFDRNGKTK